MYALAVSGSDLYAGGWFTGTADGAVILNRIAKFSGGAWSALPHNGLDSYVYALAFSGSDLYVGGYFTQTTDGAVTHLNYIAKFSGGAWSALPNRGLSFWVYALAVSGSDLYVGGYFSQTFDGAVTNLNHIAKFSGGAWSALPNGGLNGNVDALAVSGSDLYVGGSFFQTADGAVTNLNDIAKLSSTTMTTTTTVLGSSPNPSSFGQSVTFTATVAPTSDSGTPTGTVTFKDGGTNITGCASQTVNSSAQATCVTSSLGVATHPITADYSGDTNFSASTGTLTGGQVVNQASTTTTITSLNPNPSVVGQAVVVSFSVTSLGGTPTGNVTVSDGTVNCLGTVAAGMCNITFTTAGNKTLTATYAGDANFNISSGIAAHQVNDQVNVRLFLPLIMR